MSKAWVLESVRPGLDPGSATDNTESLHLRLLICTMERRLIQFWEGSCKTENIRTWRAWQRIGTPTDRTKGRMEGRKREGRMEGRKEGREGGKERR